MFAAGHSVEQKPIIEGRKNPDFINDDEIFDNYAPKTNSLRNIRDFIQLKITEYQTKSIILNLHDTSVTVKEIDNYLLFYPIDGLNKLWIIDSKSEIDYLRNGKK